MLAAGIGRKYMARTARTTCCPWLGFALAFVGQTAHGAETFQSERARFTVEIVASGLTVPSSMSFLPDGRALVTERAAARLDIIDLESGAVTPLDGVPEVHLHEGDGDAGLCDVLVHPAYAGNGWIYFAYSAGDPASSTTVVDRARLDGTALTGFERVFTARADFEDNYHYGVRLLLDAGYLFIAVGDRHHQDQAQRLDSHAGKIVRLHEDGRVPDDNPFVDTAEALPEIWSYGHRNPQGLARHPQTGELWAHEHGPRGGDEINVIHAGRNYGWPVISWGWEYEGGPIGEGIVAKDGMEQPLHVYTPAIAPSDMTFYTGAAFPAWRGDLFIGSLARTHLNRLVIRDGAVVVEERLLGGRFGRIRFVRQGPDGLLYLGSDSGQILRLRPAD
jgi:glucose/arabinose dehydrogenase